MLLLSEYILYMYFNPYPILLLCKKIVALYSASSEAYGWRFPDASYY